MKQSVSDINEKRNITSNETKTYSLQTQLSKTNDIKDDAITSNEHHTRHQNPYNSHNSSTISIHQVPMNSLLLDNNHSNNSHINNSQQNNGDHYPLIGPNHPRTNTMSDKIQPDTNTKTVHRKQTSSLSMGFIKMHNNHNDNTNTR